jgi:DNA-binding transcriptional LysR family regulator
VIPETLAGILFARERHALYCGRGHRLHGVRNLRLDDLRGEPFVSFTADVLGGHHMGPVTAVRAYASFGIGMLPMHLTGELVARGELWQLPPYENLPVTETFQIANRSSPLNAAEAAFLERCRGVPACDYV